MLCRIRFRVSLFLASAYAFTLPVYFGCQASDPAAPPGGCDSKAPVTVTDTAFGVTLISPNGCETYHVGDTVPISFEYRNARDTIYFVDLKFSNDDGKTFALPLSVLHGANGGNGVRWHGNARKDTLWVIPAPDSTDPSRSFVSGQARIKVEDYTNKEKSDISDQAFSIRPR